MIEFKTFSDIRDLGNLRKVSVVRPYGNKPDLAFKVPTCINRDSSFVLHGKVGLFKSQ